MSILKISLTKDHIMYVHVCTWYKNELNSKTYQTEHMYIIRRRNRRKRAINDTINELYRAAVN